MWRIRGFPHRTSEPQWPTQQLAFSNNLYLFFLPFWSHFPLLSHSGIQGTSRISDWPVLYLTLCFQKNSAWDKANIGSYLGFGNSLLSGLLATCCPTRIHSAHSGQKDPSKTTMMTVISLLKIISTSSPFIDTIQTLTILWRFFMTWVLGQQLLLWIFSSPRLCCSRSEVLCILLVPMITLAAPSSHMLLQFFV